MNSRSMVKTMLWPRCMVITYKRKVDGVVAGALLSQGGKLCISKRHAGKEEV